MRQRISSLLARATMTLLLAVLTTVTAWADTWPEYISEVKVLGASASNITALKTQYKNAGWTIIDFELNDGAGGDWIYLAYKKASRNSTDYGYITDFYISNHNGIKTLPSSVSYDGKTYYLCDYAGDSYFCSLKGDLNSDAGGDDIHLYYTKENFDDRRVVNNIYFNTTQSGAVKKNGNEGNGYDLNTGCGSSSTDIYMHLTTTTKTNRPTTDPVMASGLVYNGSEQQLIATPATLANGTMKYRIGTSGDWKTNISQLTATNAGDYIVQYYAGLTPYSNVSTTHQTTVSIAKSPNSDVTVSCADILEGNTLTPQLGGNLSTGAVTYKYCTTPDGTYTTTAPTAHGTYYVKATIASDNNCEEFTTAAATFTIRHDWTLHNSGNSEDDPYVISTTDDLDLLAQRVNAGTDYKNKFFKLGADITYSHTTDWDDATSTENNFTAIGKYSHIFRGTFDGNGKTISGIRISLKDFYNGLFGYIDDGATVKNVIVSDARIIGWSFNGGIAGECKQSTITNCWVKSDVCIGEGYEIGGITGENINGTISGCRSEATLKAYRSDYKEYGGITGYANSIAVSHCVVVGATIPEVSNYRGAVVGANYSSTLTTNYYSACTVAGVANAANVGRQGADAAGARQAVAIGAATDVTITPVGTETVYDVSGITAYEGNNGIIYGGQLYAGATETVTLTIAYTAPEYFALNGFTDGNGNALTDNGDGTYTLTMTGAAATITPDLTDLWGITAGRDGSTAAKAYLITTPAGLDLLASRVNGGNSYQGTYFVLGNDIVYGADALTLDLDNDGNNDSNYMPVGKNGSGFSFMGNFDGQGHIISGIRVNANGMDYIGVFGINDGTVKNLTVSDCLFAGDSPVGAIAGFNRGTVENCHVAADVSVTGNNGVGGIVGNNDGNITFNRGSVLGCTSAAALSAKEYAGFFGGIAGRNSGTLTDNLFTGTIDKMPDGSWGIGAITGNNDTERGTLTNNFHTCSGMGGVGNDNNTNTDQAGAQFAVPRSTQPDASIIGEEKKTYGGTQYTGITAYENGLYYNGKYYYFSLWGGSGTEADPYVIYNTQGMDLLASRVNGGNSYQDTYFVLGDNIVYTPDVLTLDLDGDGNNDSNYMPVGKNGSPFMGNFDGQGHTISGIRVNANNMNFIGGVFGINDGTVKNLTVSDCLFAGRETIGAIAGLNRGTVENCHVAAYVSVIGESTVGGVVGNNDGTTHRGFVLGCTSAATLSAKESADFFGGIAGGNTGSLTDNLFTGTIDKMPDGSWRIGAITGYHDTDYGGTLTNNFHTCSGMGGVGNENNATNTDQAGAFLAVSSTTMSGGFGEVTTTYGEDDYIGITAYEYGLYYDGEYYEKDPSIVVWSGKGTAENPYVIRTTAELDLLATNVNGGNYYDGSYFVLGDNIVYTPDVLTLDLDNDGENDSNYMPVGNDDASFYGNFDGQGHTISGIRVNANGMHYIGVFGSNDGTVKNLTVSDCLFAGDSPAGAIAGLNRGTVENCHVAADVSVIGKSTVGGIVGDNDGATHGGFVLGCTSAATLSAKESADFFGGIAGGNTGSLTDNLFTGTIDKIPDGSSDIGAITGYNNTERGTLTNNFHTCSGMGGVGNDNDATNTDQAGAQFAVSNANKPAAITGDPTATYGTEESPGIKAYGNYGLEYGGKYYYYGTTPPIELGDANGDGNISVTDIAVVVNYILQLPNTNFSFTGADANGDGYVTVTDIGVIVDMILGNNVNNNANAGNNNNVEPQ